MVDDDERASVFVFVSVRSFAGKINICQWIYTDFFFAFFMSQYQQK